MPAIRELDSAAGKLSEGTTPNMSIVVGSASTEVVNQFNCMVRTLGSVLKALQELLSRQYSQKIERPSMVPSEECKEWIIDVPEHEDAMAIQTVLMDLDVFVSGNGLKDRSSGIEDLLFRNGTYHESNSKNPVTTEKLVETFNRDQSALTNSSDKTILVFVETNNDSTDSVCSLCEESFLSQHELEEHIFDKHSADLAFPEAIDQQDVIKCPLCDEFFELRTLLQEHCRQDHLRHVSFTADGNMKLSANELTKCPECDYTALRKGRMSTHLRKVHQIIEDISCEICRKAFSSHRAMVHHFQQQHTMINSTCDICGKVCKNRAAYQNHSLAHKRSFQCRYCEKTFNDRRCYTQHEKRHLTKTIQLCNYCGQQFNLKSNLERHIRITHLKEGKLSCDSCSFTTFYKDNLKEHINKVHIGIKKGKFTCHHCGKEFSRRMVYEEHMDRHDGKYRYSCQICGKKFRNKSRCNQHLLHCPVRKGRLETGDPNRCTENSELCVVADVTETLPDPDNLGLIVTMDFVQGGDVE